MIEKTFKSIIDLLIMAALLLLVPMPINIIATIIYIRIKKN